MKLIDRLKELYDRDFPSNATEENNEEYREFIEGLVIIFPRLLQMMEVARRFIPEPEVIQWEQREIDLRNIFNTLDETDPGCEKCGHNWFDTVHSSGDPDPGYRCKKCGYIEWI